MTIAIVPGDRAALLLRNGAFNECYETYSGIIYNIVLRVAGTMCVPADIMRDVFLCINKQDRFREHVSLLPRQIFPIVFNCLSKAMATNFTRQEIEDRIAIERSRLLHQKRP